MTTIGHAQNRNNRRADAYGCAARAAIARFKMS